ncbi:MAG: hypothetical protein AB7K24_03670 [Gemmataceae bacterium]
MLQNRQRFLGEGIAHYFTAAQGTFLLPRATQGTTLPVIQNAPLDAITLASSVEVSGFSLANPTRHGILAQNVSNANINSTSITGGGGSGIASINSQFICHSCCSCGLAKRSRRSVSRQVGYRGCGAFYPPIPPISCEVDPHDHCTAR